VVVKRTTRLLSLHGQTGTTNGIGRAQNGKSSKWAKEYVVVFFIKKKNPNFYLLKYIG
jgi:hypothetical protein